jgi:hypothetical protein
MTFGSEIVESFYDYETHTIGPYTVPLNISYNQGSCQGNAFSMYRYYDTMMKDEEALAVFNVNNYCLCVLHKDYIRMIHVQPAFSKSGQKPLPAFNITPPITVPEYKHIGWVKTYQKCLAVYTWPWHLIQNKITGEVWNFKDKISGRPLENPPLGLYKELVETDHRGVYFDLDKNAPVFID